jgi:hypothetical protein
MIPFQLGKKAVRHDPRTFKLARYLTTLPPVPSAIDWSGKVPAWLMLANDQVGDCTCAAAGHLEMLWTSQTQTEFIPTDAAVLAAYSAITGYTPANPATDTGADELSVLNYWRNSGIAGHKIFSYASVSLTRPVEIQAAIAFFGGLYIGVQLPQTAMDATNSGQVWSVTTDPNILGGHAVPLVAYCPDGLVCITWGQLQKMTWAWLAQYADEAYCVLSPDWIAASGLSPAGFNLSQLIQDLAQL